MDRETPESYSETQSKAANLVDIFKVYLIVIFATSIFFRSDEQLWTLAPITITHYRIHPSFHVISERLICPSVYVSYSGTVELCCTLINVFQSMLTDVHPSLFVHFGSIPSSDSNAFCGLIWGAFLFHRKACTSISSRNDFCSNFLYSSFFHLLHRLFV